LGFLLLGRGESELDCAPFVEDCGTCVVELWTPTYQAGGTLPRRREIASDNRSVFLSSGTARSVSKATASITRVGLIVVRTAGSLC